MEEDRSVIIQALVLIFSLVLVSLALAVVSVGVVYYLFDDSSNFERVEKERTYSYQSLVYNIASDEFSVGSVGLLNELPNDFLSNVDEEGNLLLISNFGDDEYYCSGTCTCDEPERRVGGSASISTTIMYLVAAASSLVAYNLAKTHFQEECEREFKDSCGGSAMKSEVDHCGIFKKKNMAVIEEGYGPGEEYKYFCSGNCVFVEDYEGILIVKEKEKFMEEKRMFCMDLKLEKEVVISSVIAKNLYSKAKKQFEEEDLTPFCKKQSTLKQSEVTSLLQEKFHQLHERTPFTWCENYTVKGGEIVYGDVSCRKL